MLSQTQIWRVWAGVLACLLLCFPRVRATGESQLGRILYSHATDLRGRPVPGSETILSGDVLTTGEDGNALVELKSGTRMQMTPSTSVRFLVEGGTVQAELSLGAVISETAGKSATVVSTPKYQFVPAQEGECRYLVQIYPERSTLAGAIQGNLLIQARNGAGSYVLHEGNYAAISPSAVGVPGQAPQAPVRLGAQLTVTATNVIPDAVIQRGGQTMENPLKVNDQIYWEDNVRTLPNGRLRAALSDGTSLNIGSDSSVRFFRNDATLQQTQINLNAGELRAWVAKLVLEYANFLVQTPTAIIGAVGTDFIVDSQPTKTTVYCLEGSVSVQNSDPDVPRQVTLHAGEYTSVASGQPPTAPAPTSNALLQAQINETTVGQATGPAAGQATTAAAKAGWHIGSLSEGASIGVIAAVAGGAAGAAIAVGSSHGSSSSSPSPASPSSP